MSTQLQIPMPDQSDLPAELFCAVCGQPAAGVFIIKPGRGRYRVGQRTAPLCHTHRDARREPPKKEPKKRRFHHPGR